MAISNIVVLMFENRSYDNVLGALYMNQPAPAGQWSLDGLTGNETNPNPPGPPVAVHGTQWPEAINGTGPVYPPTCIPMTDPGEPFGEMAQQYLSLPAVPASAPYTNYNPDAPGLMQGFVANYAAQDAPPSNLGDVMNYLTPEQMPVTAWLAQNYAVCDQWFASVPTQTFTNRTFALLGGPIYQTPSQGQPFSWVDDAQWTETGILESAGSPSIFKQLDAFLNSGNYSASDWKVYFHDLPLSAICDIYVLGAALSGSSNVNLSAFDSSDYGTGEPPHITLAPGTFVSDAAGGTLPMLSFIEPRYFAHGGLPANSNHPGLSDATVPAVSSYVPQISAANNVPIDAASGELLLLQVYNMLVANPTLWSETLLIVTYDEPGGTFDHVAPPLAVPPGGSFPSAQNPDDPAANGFLFNVLGGRVPALIISPAINPGTTIRAATPFDHTSIIRTAWDAFLSTDGTTSLTARDAAAPSLLPLLDATTPNPTGAYSGPIVCGPSAVVILGSGTAIVCASAGTTELTATMASQPAWITSITPSWSGATPPVNVVPNTLTVTLTIDATGITSMQQTSFTIGPASGTTPATVTIPVTLAPQI